jgi:hypothetical protein
MALWPPLASTGVKEAPSAWEGHRIKMRGRNPVYGAEKGVIGWSSRHELLTAQLDSTESSVSQGRSERSRSMPLVRVDGRAFVFADDAQAFALGDGGS